MRNSGIDGGLFGSRGGGKANCMQTGSAQPVFSLISSEKLRDEPGLDRLHDRRDRNPDDLLWGKSFFPHGSIPPIYFLPERTQFENGLVFEEK